MAMSLSKWKTKVYLEGSTWPKVELSDIEDKCIADMKKNWEPQIYSELSDLYEEHIIQHYLQGFGSIKF